MRYNKDIRKQKILQINNNSIGNTNTTTSILTTKNINGSRNSSKEDSGKIDQKVFIKVLDSQEKPTNFSNLVESSPFKI